MAKNDLEEREKIRISRRKNHPNKNELQLRDLHSFLHSEPSGICRCTPTGMSTTVSMLNELQLWDLGCLLTPPAPEESAGPAQTCTTGTSNTLSMDCNWGISVVC